MIAQAVAERKDESTPRQLSRRTSSAALLGSCALLLWLLLTALNGLSSPAGPRLSPREERPAPAVAAARGDAGSLTATITTTVAFAQAEYVVGEGDGLLTITLAVNPPPTSPVTATVSTEMVSATATKDYLALRQIDVIPPGATALTVTIQIVDDALVEGEERFQISLSNVAGAQPGAITETNVAIQDNDTAYLGVVPVSVDERAKAAVMVITQSLVSTLESVVDYTTVEGSAQAGRDFGAAFGTATIPPGSTATTITIAITDDTEIEPPESFMVQLLDPLNAALGQMTATVTILDDDSLPRLSITDTAASEDEGRLLFPVTLDMSWPTTVTVGYATGVGSATPGADYAVAGGSLVLPPGTTGAEIAVQIYDDFVPEAVETVTVMLVAPVHAQIAVTMAQGFIFDAAHDHTYLPGMLK